MVQALGHGYREHGHELVLVAPGDAARTERRPWGTQVTLPGRRVPWSGGYRVLVDLARVRATVDRLAPDRIEVSDRVTLRSVGAWARSVGVPALMIASSSTPLRIKTARALSGYKSASATRRTPGIRDT